jgi:hypothetical protein
VKRAASPGAVSLYSLRKDRNRSKLHGSNIINCRTFFDCYSMFDENDFLYYARKNTYSMGMNLPPLFRTNFIISSQLLIR